MRPLVAETPIYRLQYIQQGEAARGTRLALENSMKSVEAALVRGGVAPPAAQDLVTLSGRVTTLENAKPGPWIAASVAVKGNLGGGFAPVRYRLRPADNSVEIRGVMGSAATPGSALMFTLPVGMRPSTTQIFSSQHGGAGSIGVYIAPTGAVNMDASTTWVSLNIVCPLDLA